MLGGQCGQEKTARMSESRGYREGVKLTASEVVVRRGRGAVLGVTWTVKVHEGAVGPWGGGRVGRELSCLSGPPWAPSRES